MQEKNKNEIQKPRRILIIVSLGIITIVLIALFMMGKKSNNKPLNAASMFTKQGELTFQKKDGKLIVTIDIEIADNEDKREVGLMGRPVMDENQGMLFILENEQMATFWMRNTLIPLDMIFINKVGEIVTICKNTSPFSDQTYSATELSLFVLEVNSGFTDKYNIKAGDSIVWKRI
jgi:uncharacterized protein